VERKEIRKEGERERERERGGGDKTFEMFQSALVTIGLACDWSLHPSQGISFGFSSPTTWKI